MNLFMAGKYQKIEFQSIFWFVVVIVIFLMVVVGSWLGSRSYVIYKAEKDIETMLLQHKGAHHYIQRLALPELYSLKQNNKIPEDLYSPILFSSSYMVRNMHNYYNEERLKLGLSELYYKMASENPRNSVNKANSFEAELIRMFNEDNSPTSYRQLEKRDGKEYLYVAIPFLRNEKKCMVCHGRYEDAPIQLQERYPDRGGFDEKIGDVRAIESLRAPLDGELTLAYTAMISSSAACIIVLSLLLLTRRLNSLVSERTELVEKQASELRESKENLSITLNSIGDAVIATDQCGIITMMNPVAESLTGYSFDSNKETHLDGVFTVVNADTRSPFPVSIEQVLNSGQKLDAENAMLLINDGSECFISQSVAPIHSATGDIVGMVLVFRDRTNEKQIEQHLRQVEKMTSIGQLAGGVAHDFNNMLAGITGASELLGMKLSEDIKAMKYVDIIKNAAERTSGLTQKLLAFSRKGKQVSVSVNVHSVINDAISILERSIDKRISIKTQLNAECSTVVGDPAQLQSGFLNLFINARDAMPDGGELLIKTANAVFNDQYCYIDSKLNAGHYIQISIKDTGTGIPVDIQPHVFEPFYTTKDVGKGTGLGLAAVYGMIQEHHGDICLHSVPEEGTVFHIYLPNSNDGSSPTLCNDSHVHQGSGTILLVDDEEILRTTGSLLLEQLGYRVIVADNGARAVDIYAKKIDEIDLIILDMIMPVLDGTAALGRIQALNSEAKVIMSSGFIKDVDISSLKDQGLSGFIMKPFSQAQMSKLIAEVMTS